MSLTTLSTSSPEPDYETKKPLIQSVTRSKNHYEMLFATSYTYLNGTETVSEILKSDIHGEIVIL